MRAILVGGTDNLFAEVARRPATQRLFGFPERVVSEDAGQASFELKKLDENMGVCIEARQGNTFIKAALTQELLEEALAVIKSG